MKPDRIGPYRIHDTVAEDALTVTYRAEDPGLGRALLLKTARASVEPSAVRDRLLHEARIVAPLAHPGILALYGLVRRDDAVHLLFEDVRGPRLDEVLARTRPLSLLHALAVTAGIASALAHVHARGLWHGGIRPERIALTRAGLVQLVDFSTAHPIGAKDTGDDEPPRPPEYMAPEQILSEGAGPRADIFSTGVVLFEMLAGRRPFDPPPPRSLTRTPLDRATLQRDARTSLDRGASSSTQQRDLARFDPLAPSPPPDDDRRALAHRIRSSPPPPLPAIEGPAAELVARIVFRCLAKDPADRYPDASALAEDLDSALHDLATEPPTALVVRALAAADFAPDLPPRPARIATELAPERDTLTRLYRQLATLFAIIILGALVTEWSRAGERPAPPPSETPPGARGYLRVLAQPWAEVIIDGETIDTTPMARPIPVAPGRHFVTFVHPNAPEEKRTVTVTAGQTILVDVAMRIDRPRPDAGPDAAPIDETP